MTELATPATAVSRPTVEDDTLCLFLAGTGHVGHALLRQLASLEQAPVFVLGTCTTRRTHWHQPSDEQGVPFVVERSEKTDWPSIVERLVDRRPGSCIFVDATGSPDVARRYEYLLAHGVHVVTPSKRANTFEQSYFDRLTTLARSHGLQYRYETTVGAGLPVVRVIRDLLATGDRIRCIRGAVSGTLTYIFSLLERGAPFSEAVRTAVERGYTEPDVRDDLSGEDVARKFMILARTSGHTIERSELEVESLVPEAFRAVERSAVVDALADLNEAWSQRVAAAKQRGCVLRYAGVFENGTVSVGVREVAVRSSLGALDGTDNLFEIYTDRYDASPLTVRGPGAGPEVTAAGVLADVLSVVRDAARDTTRGNREGA